MANWMVTEQAVEALQSLSNQLGEQETKISNEMQKLMLCYEENEEGLGAHAGSIGSLLDEMCLAECEGGRALKKLQLKLERSASVRKGLLEKNRYASNSDSAKMTIDGRIQSFSKSNGSDIKTYTALGKNGDSELTTHASSISSKVAMLESLELEDGRESICERREIEAHDVMSSGFVNSFDSMVSSSNEDSFKPTRQTPRDLAKSQYGFVTNASGMEVYDSPLEMDKYLYSNQGSAYDNFKGTCGLCSCANVLRLAGVNYGEKEMIDYAADPQGGLFSSKLCTVNPFNPSASGGTTPKQRQQILDHFGVSSSIWNIKTDSDGKTSMETINDIGTWVSEGRGVIVDVDAGLFYNSPSNLGKGHAVTITSVERNKYGDITAFYILDSNQGTVKYTSWEIQEMLRTFVGINVTSQIIR